MPETSDSEFTWSGYVSANNNELVATLGNLVHRILTISHRNFDSINAPDTLNENDNAILDHCNQTLDKVFKSF